MRIFALSFNQINGIVEKLKALMEKSETRRQEIMDAAMHCLARYGMTKTTMDDIAEVMGLNKATLYYYYDNKEAIISDALERDAYRFYAILEDRFKTIPKATEKIKTMVQTFFEFFRNRLDILQLNARALIDNHTLIQNIHRRMRDKHLQTMYEIIEEGVHCGEFPDSVDVQRVADALRLILDAHRLELFRQSADPAIKQPDLDKLENDAIFIMNIFLNGLKKGPN
ncbi:MAG: TetR family transcriptional regulator [Caldithrix sp.]|nr:TetR family transcriptional regulator [Caldithrix sp.]